MYNKLLSKTKLSHHGHTGKVLHHSHTMYPVLVALLAMTALIVVLANNSVYAVGSASEQGDIRVSGIVKGPAPTQQAVITSPITGTTYPSRLVAISGKCAYGFFVDVYSNNIFSGSVECDKNSNFRLFISLFPGKNVLIAKVEDALGQDGPDSAPVIVYYNEPEEIRSPVVSDLVVKLKDRYVGLNPKQTFNLRPELVGGKGPYTLDIDWKDGESFHAHLKSEGLITATHSYSKPGNYRITVLAADSHARAYQIGTMVIVNGVSQEIFATGNNGNSPRPTPINSIRSAIAQSWVSVSATTIMLGGFWAAQKVSYAKMLHQIKLKKNLNI